MPRVLRGRTDDPVWVRPALLALLLATAVLYLWDLGASRWANDFYAAATQSGTMSWKAFFFGSSDPANSITVDKPPASLWVMALSGRIFGFSSWSMLAPQAVEGVAAVWLLYASVRRWSGPAAGLVAGTLFALTPVTVLMFRFNNPDALLVLLMVAAAYCVVRAVDAAGRGAGTGWLALAGVAIGFAFLTKMLQAFLVMPALALVYLLVASIPLWRRVWQLLVAGGALLVAAGWWVLAVELWPKDSRPYIGGSETNSVLDLTFGYNGLGRIFSGGGPGGGGPSGGGPSGSGPSGSGPTGGGPGGGGFGGQTGLGRMFNETVGTQVAWLLPAALIALVAGLWLTYRAPRTDRTRASLVLWGGWLVVTMLVFSYMEGIFHEYYTIALAPAIGGVIGVGGQELWRHRGSVAARVTMAAAVGATGVTAWVLLGRSADWNPWLRWVVAVCALVAALVVLVGVRVMRRAAIVGAAAVAVAGLAGPAAYAAQTAGTPHTGSTPGAGPGGQTPGGPGGGPGGTVLGPTRCDQCGTPPSGSAPQGGQAPGGNQPGGNQPGGNQPGGNRPELFRRSGGPAATVNAALVKLLKATNTTWAAAAMSSGSASGLQLSSGKAVMPIGGFGGDPSPTLAQFRKWVAAGKVHYFVGDSAQAGSQPPSRVMILGQGGNRGGPGGTSGIATWVAAHFTPMTVGGTTVYDLTKPKS